VLTLQSAIARLRPGSQQPAVARPGLAVRRTKGVWQMTLNICRACGRCSCSGRLISKGPRRGSRCSTSPSGVTTSRFRRPPRGEAWRHFRRRWCRLHRLAQAQVEHRGAQPSACTGAKNPGEPSAARDAVGCASQGSCAVRPTRRWPAEPAHADAPQVNIFGFERMLSLQFGEMGQQPVCRAGPGGGARPACLRVPRVRESAT